MKIKITALILTIALFISGMAITAFADSADVGIQIQPTMLSATVTISNDIIINPNAANEEDIITISAVTFKNNTACPVAVSFETIEYMGKMESDVLNNAFNGPNVFCSYTQDAILDNDGDIDTVLDWAKLGMTATHTYMGFGLQKMGSTTEFNDLLPDNTYDVLTLSSKFDTSGEVADTATNKVTLDLDLKAGRAWGSSHAGTHKYSVVFTFALADDTFVG